jgi:hypothetical protein
MKGTLCILHSFQRSPRRPDTIHWSIRSIEEMCALGCWGAGCFGEPNLPDSDTESPDTAYPTVRQRIPIKQGRRTRLILAAPSHRKQSRSNRDPQSGQLARPRGVLTNTHCAIVPRRVHMHGVVAERVRIGRGLHSTSNTASLIPVWDRSAP